MVAIAGTCGVTFAFARALLVLLCTDARVIIARFAFLNSSTHSSVLGHFTSHAMSRVVALQL
jgi:hypothetical protein